MVSHRDSYGIAPRWLVAGTRPATTLAAKLAASSAETPTPLRLLIVMTGLPDFCLLDF